MTDQASPPLLGPSNNSGTTDSDPQPIKKKPYVRVMTDKRREQNRRAQKIYREKLKRKLEDLEDQVAITPTNKNEAESNEAVNAEAAQEPTPFVTHEPNIIILDDLFIAAGDLPISNSSYIQGFQLPVTIETPEPTPSPPPKPHRRSSPSFTDGLLTEDYGNLDMRGIWKMPHRPAGKAYKPPSSTGTEWPAYRSRTVSPEQAYNAQRRMFFHHLSTQSQAPTSTSTSSSLSKATTLARGPHPYNRPTLPSPYLNHLTLTAHSNFAATLSIALSLGITPTAYIQDHPSTFPACFTQFWPSASASPPSSTTPTSTPVTSPRHPQHAAFLAFQAGQPDAAPPQLTQHMQRVTPALRPRPVQLTAAHPSYLDCIVFPTVRERVVQASVDGVLDHTEFFLDLMHGGLVCWGGAAAGGGGSGRRGMADGVAWSPRSWEARRWWLRKWEWLVGSEEDEERSGESDGVWAGSRWWWAVRGDVEVGQGWSEEDERDGVRTWAEGDVCPKTGRLGAAAFIATGEMGI